MRPLRSALAAAAVAASCALAPDLPKALATWPLPPVGRPFVVKDVQLGTLERNTREFLPHGAPGEVEAYRDDIILITFSRKIRFDTVGPRTIRIQTRAPDGTWIDAPGSYRRHVVYKYDNVSQTFVPWRTFRNRVVFHPSDEYGWDIHPCGDGGWVPGQEVRVFVTGEDRGQVKTVKSRRGRSLEVGYKGFFTAQDAWNVNYGPCAPVDE